MKREGAPAAPVTGPSSVGQNRHDKKETEPGTNTRGIRHNTHAPHRQPLVNVWIYDASAAGFTLNMCTTVCFRLLIGQCRYRMRCRFRKNTVKFSLKDFLSVSSVAH